MTLNGVNSSISLDGLSLSQKRADGVMIVAEDILGWGSPQTTTSPEQRPRANGAWAGESYLTARSLVIPGHIAAPTWSQASQAFDELVAACALSDVPLTVDEDGIVRSIQVRRQTDVLHRRIGNNAIAWSISLIALDPRKTGANLQATTGLPGSVGGLTIPYTIPYTIDATSSSGEVSLVNPGNTAGKVLLRITAGAGGLTGPVVTHVSSGKTVRFSASLTIPEGNFVDVDMDAHTVLENGTASRNGWVTGRGWSSFQPGSNVWSFTSVSGDGTLRVTATPSWA